jgi:hypothetical protein
MNFYVDVTAPHPQPYLDGMQGSGNHVLRDVTDGVYTSQGLSQATRAQYMELAVAEAMYDPAVKCAGGTAEHTTNPAIANAYPGPLIEKATNKCYYPYHNFNGQPHDYPQYDTLCWCNAHAFDGDGGQWNGYGSHFTDIGFNPWPPLDLRSAGGAPRQSAPRHRAPPVNMSSAYRTYVATHEPLTDGLLPCGPGFEYSFESGIYLQSAAPRSAFHQPVTTSDAYACAKRCGTVPSALHFSFTGNDYMCRCWSGDEWQSSSFSRVANATSGGACFVWW